MSISNRWLGIGRIGSEAVDRGHGQDRVLCVKLVVDSDGEEPLVFELEFSGRHANIIASNCSIGDKIAVEGEIVRGDKILVLEVSLFEVRKWEDRKVA